MLLKTFITIGSGALPGKMLDLELLKISCGVVFVEPYPKHFTKPVGLS